MKTPISLICAESSRTQYAARTARDALKLERSHTVGPRRLRCRVPTSVVDEDIELFGLKEDEKLVASQVANRHGVTGAREALTFGGNRVRADGRIRRW
jgi:hypothetical protein